MEMTAEQIAEIAAKAATDAVDKANLKPIRTKPNLAAAVAGASGGEVTLDEADQKWPNMGEFLHKVKDYEITKGASFDPRLRRKTVPTGGGEMIPAEGGFLVAQEFIPQLITRTWNTGVLPKLCQKQQVGPNFNGVKIPAIDETSRANGYRWGGVRAYWAGEGATLTPSKPGFRQISVELQKLIGLCYVTDELLQDSVALEGYINTWFPLEFGFKMDDALINGDGSGKPLGFMKSPALLSVAKETGQASATVVAENIINMWARMWAPSRANAIWMIAQDVEPALAKMAIAVGTGGIPVYFPMGSGPWGSLAGTPIVSNAAYATATGGTLYGRPVYVMEQCQTLGTTGDILLVDPTQYLIIEKGDMTMASSIHVQFVTDETAFRWTYRVNGVPIWHSYLTPFTGSNTLSPYIKLDAR